MEINYRESSSESAAAWRDYKKANPGVTTLSVTSFVAGYNAARIEERKWLGEWLEKQKVTFLYDEHGEIIGAKPLSGVEALKRGERPKE